MAGYIKLHRQITEHEFYKEPRKFSRFEAWIDILLRTYYKEKDNIQVGTFPTSYGELAKAWKWNKKSVWSFLKQLARENMIIIQGNGKVTAKETVITIVNWGVYQGRGNGKGNGKVTISEFLPYIFKEERNIYSDLLSFWNEQKIIKHQEVSEDLKKAIDEAVKKHGQEKITQAIQRYGKVYHDPEYFFTYKWTLLEFLKRKNGLPDFLDGGSKWEDYKAKKQAKPKPVQTPQEKPTSPGGIISGEFEIYQPPNLFDD